MVSTFALIGAAVGLGCGIGVGWALVARRKRGDGGLGRKATETELVTGDFNDEYSSGECKLVLVVRTDLKMGKGKTAAQCCHASVMAYQRLHDKFPELLEEWRYHGQAKVVLRTDSEQSLLQLAADARKAGLIVSLVQDAGRTQVAPGSKTVLGVGPGPKELIDKVTGHLKLF